KVFGLAALAAGMLYNVHMIDAGNETNISLSALGNVAEASSEAGGGDKWIKVSYTQIISTQPFRYVCNNQYKTGYNITSETTINCIRGGEEDCVPGTYTITTTTRPC